MGVHIANKKDNIIIENGRKFFLSDFDFLESVLMKISEVSYSVSGEFSAILQLTTTKNYFRITVSESDDNCTFTGHVLIEIRLKFDLCKLHIGNILQKFIFYKYF